MVKPQIGSLYLELAEVASAQKAAGRTDVTKSKETVDGDIEALVLEILIT